MVGHPRTPGSHVPASAGEPSGWVAPVTTMTAWSSSRSNAMPPQPSSTRAAPRPAVREKKSLPEVSRSMRPLPSDEYEADGGLARASPVGTKFEASAPTAHSSRRHCEGPPPGWRALPKPTGRAALRVVALFRRCRGKDAAGASAAALASEEPTRPASGPLLSGPATANCTRCSVERRRCLRRDGAWRDAARRSQPSDRGHWPPSGLNAEHAIAAHTCSSEAASMTYTWPTGSLSLRMPDAACPSAPSAWPISWPTT